MSGKDHSNPRQTAQQASKSGPVTRKPDERALRSRRRLGDAFLELIHEKSIEDVTVQEILERAAVGRSTFYLHFRDKNDLLLCQLERFLEMMSTLLSTRNEASQRVVAVAEMFAHIESQRELYRILADAGRLNDFFDLAQDYFTRGIERRLRESGRFTKVPKSELNARSSALAGSLLSLLRWWLDRGAKEPPADMDKLFHNMVWNGVR
jgi:AcrR family transcriptional regulator